MKRSYERKLSFVLYFASEKCNESFESPLQVSTTPKASRFSLSKRLPNFHHRFYHQDTPQRCNPFKVNKEKSTANDSSISFFENVENDRQTAKTLDKKSRKSTII